MMNHEECLAYLKAHTDYLEFENIGDCYGSLVLTYDDSTYTLGVESSASWSGYAAVPNYVGDALVNFHKENYSK